MKHQIAAATASKTVAMQLDTIASTALSAAMAYACRRSRWIRIVLVIVLRQSRVVCWYRYQSSVHGEVRTMTMTSIHIDLM